MVITARCTHKIALVDRTSADASRVLCSALEAQGVSARSLDDLSDSNDVPVDSTVLCVRIREFSRSSLQALLHEIPELAGVLFVYPSSVRTYQVLRDTSIARSERVAVVGALFGEEGDGIDGRRICRDVGIPYLGTGSPENVSGTFEVSSLVRLFSG